MKPVLAIDQGTTSSRTLIFGGPAFEVLASSQREFPLYYPEPGWVEQDAEEIWQTQCATLEQAMRKARLKAGDIGALGLTNQRETVVAWDKATGRPLAKAVVWQDRRTAGLCAQLRDRGLEAGVRRKTGLLFDPYFSATKMQWLLRHVPEVKAAARRGTLALGTIDSWLIYKLTGGRSHVTEAGNASRTLLFNVKTLRWDPSLLDLFGIPLSALPEVLDSDAEFGVTDLPFLPGVPIRGVLGDQQAALFGHRCFKPGQAKNTYGTGCFLLRQIGAKFLPPPKGLLGTVAWKIAGQTAYAHEGAVLVAGAAVQFLRDGLKIIAHAEETEALAQSLPGNEGVYFVPAFAGLGTPYWDADARGLIIGMTRGTGRAHLARAALEAIAYQSSDLCAAMGQPAIRVLQADGGATRNPFLMQFQADILGIPVEVSDQAEITALGAATLAALGAGLISRRELTALPKASHTYRPRLTATRRRALLEAWHEAVLRSRGWART